MEKISWTDRVRNEEVLHRVKEERNISIQHKEGSKEGRKQERKQARNEASKEGRKQARKERRKEG
jgi:hypothetical protein